MGERYKAIVFSEKNLNSVFSIGRRTARFNRLLLWPMLTKIITIGWRSISPSLIGVKFLFWFTRDHPYVAASEIHVISVSTWHKFAPLNVGISTSLCRPIYFRKLNEFAASRARRCDSPLGLTITLQFAQQLHNIQDLCTHQLVWSNVLFGLHTDLHPTYVNPLESECFSSVSSKSGHYRRIFPARCVYCLSCVLSPSDPTAKSTSAT